MHNAADGQPPNGVAPDAGSDNRDSHDPATDDRAGDENGGGAAALSAAIAAAAALLRLAEGIATGGRKLDLSGLDERIGLVCAQALDLPPAEGARQRARLVALLRDLDALGAVLRRP